VYSRGMTQPAPALRATNLDKLAAQRFDVLVLGGGINGAVSAAALAARGAKVALIDRGDFAGVTSQQSSNLAWGGIKYLETYEVGLVRKLCRARNELIRAYPSTVQEIRFFTSIARGFRHGRLKLWLGALLYWALGSFSTRRPRLLSVADIEREEPAIQTRGLAGGFEYSDAYLHDNDARFVWGFIRSALDRGCVAANYVEALGSTRTAQGWLTRARDLPTGRELTVASAVLINACGPYADEVNARDGVSTVHRHVFSKGIHVIVDPVTVERRVLTFFADDGRLFFVIPMQAKTCIGTTDTRVDRPEVEVTPEDRRFVLDNINKRLQLPRPLEESDIIAERCGVRPLVVSGSGNGGRDWMQLSRRHAIETDRDRKRLTIFGGKLTDCINVGEEICAEVRSLVRGAARRRARRVLPPGPPDGPRRAHFPERQREALHPALAPLRRRSAGPARGHPPGPAPGGGDHRDQRVHPLRAGRGGAPRDGGEAGGLPAQAVEDRAGGARGGNPRGARVA